MLSRRATEVLKIMHDSDEELVYERGEAYVGLERTSASVVRELERAMAIRLDPYSKIGEFERYTINETGRKLLQSANAETLNPSLNNEKSTNV